MSELSERPSQLPTENRNTTVFIEFLETDFRIHLPAAHTGIHPSQFRSPGTTDVHLIYTQAELLLVS